MKKTRWPFAGCWVWLPVIAAVSCGGGGPDPFLANEAAYRANNQGVALLEQFDYESAVAAFREALEIDDSYAAARINLAIALFLDQDLEAADREAAAAALGLPAALEPPYLRGLVARAQNRGEDALAAFGTVFDADPTDVGTNVNLGQIYLETRDYAAAIERLRVAYEREPYNVTAVYNLGLALARSDAAEEGQALLEQAQALRSSGYAVTYGTGYLQQGRYAEAVASTGLEPELIDPDVPPATFTSVVVATGSPSQGSPSPGSESPFGRRYTSADLTDAAVRDLVAAMGGGVALVDYDMDGDLDLFAAQPNGQRLMRNDGPASWTDVTIEAGLADGPDGVPVGAIVADFDNDELPDVFVLRHGTSSLYRNDGSGGFSDVASGAGLSAATEGYVPGAAAFADVDHDGDADLVVAGLADIASSFAAAEDGVSLLFPDEFAAAPLRLLRNNQDGSFTDITAEAALQVEGHTVAIVPTDFDNRRDVDLLLVDRSGPVRLFANLRDSTFGDVASDVGLAAVGTGITTVAAGDLNKDDFPDFVFGRASDAVLALSDGRGRFSVTAAPEGASAARALRFLDYDNDGLLDLLAWTVEGPQLFRSLGGEWSDVTGTALTGFGLASTLTTAHAIAVADVDGDGDSDVVSADSEGMAIAENGGDSRNGSLRIALRGLASNRAGVGAKVQLRAGSLSSRLETSAATPAAAPADLVFGLGPRPGADVARVLWPSGTLQAEVPEQEYLPSVMDIQELDREPSSCPFLFAWNGTRFEFVTDFLGGGEMGLWHGPGEYNAPDPVEYVRIRGDQLQPNAGFLELRVTSELEEAVFFDQVELVVLDHPRYLELYPNEGLTDPPKPHRLHAVADIHVPDQVVDDSGDDVTELIARLDRRYPEGFGLAPIRGYADTHRLTIDVGSPGDSVVLLLTGWTSYAFSSDNVAADQAGLVPILPALEIKDVHGRWRPAGIDMGFPVGRPQTIAVDLTDALRPGEREVRIETNMRIYWDQIRVGRRDSVDDVHERRISPSTAELRVRGFSAELHPVGTQPTTYDYDHVAAASPWKTMAGSYTRAGDVVELLTAGDDLFVITRDGDEIVLRFDASVLPPLRDDQTRTYLLQADGFSKEMDINSASPDFVEPLPFHAMSEYPYDASERYPDTPTHRRYQETYNTRAVVASVPRIETSK